MVKARLRDGVTLPQAQAAMTALGARLAREYPREDPGRGVTVLASNDVRIHPEVDALLVPGASLLLTVVGLVLAIACSNLATLLLVRGSARTKDVSVRLALGATRGQIVRHLLTEHLILAMAGGALGLVFAQWAIGLMALVDLPLVVDFSLDHRVLGFTLLLSLATGLAFGLAPAFRATRVDLVSELRNEGGSLSVGRRWFTLKNVLVVSQVAVSCVLLVMAGLLLRALTGAQRTDLGYRTDGVAYIETDARWVGYEPDEALAVYGRLRERLAALPGVESAALASGPPIAAAGQRNLSIDGYDPPDDEPVNARWSWAGPGYFETLGLPLLYGRSFTAFDDPDSRAVVVISEGMARRYFGTADAVGRRFRFARGPAVGEDARSGIEVEVIGIVPDVRTSPLEGPDPRFYRSVVQAGGPMSTVIVRTSLDPASLLQPMQRALYELDASLPVIGTGTLAQYVEDSLGAGRVVGNSLAALGLLGLGLASLGLYAVVAFAVSRRSLEVGIRMALGAQRTQVIWTLSSDVAKLVGAGVTIGLMLSWMAVLGLGVLFASLSEAPNIDISRPSANAATFGVVALLMLAVGLTATILPARRAASADPLVALRHL
jgi:predicted permease